MNISLNIKNKEKNPYKKSLILKKNKQKEKKVRSGTLVSLASQASLSRLFCYAGQRDWPYCNRVPNLISFKIWQPNPMNILSRPPLLFWRSKLINLKTCSASLSFFFYWFTWACIYSGPGTNVFEGRKEINYSDWFYSNHDSNKRNKTGLSLRNCPDCRQMCFIL